MFSNKLLGTFANIALYSLLLAGCGEEAENEEQTCVEFLQATSSQGADPSGLKFTSSFSECKSTVTSDIRQLVGLSLKYALSDFESCASSPNKGVKPKTITINDNTIAINEGKDFSCASEDSISLASLDLRFPWTSTDGSVSVEVIFDSQDGGGRKFVNDEVSLIILSK